MSYEVALDGSWIRCGECGRTSYNRNDVKMRYCARCHAWLDTCCDFCSGHSGFAHDYIAGGQIRGTLSDGRDLVDRDGLWAACMVCCLLIEAGAWEALIRRVTAAHNWTERIVPRAKIIFMYKAVFAERFTLTK